jgi:RND family efflux transporter MFP subunit
MLAVVSFAAGRLTLAPEENPRAASHPLVEQSVPADARPANAAIANSDYRQIVTVQVTTVDHKAGSYLLHATGRIESDDSRTYRILAGIDGRLSSLTNTPAGTIVHKGEKLATFFNNEFVKVEQAYFFSLQTLDRVKASNRQIDIEQAEETVRSNEETLFALGMGEAQVREIAQTRQALRDIDIVSPVTGIVIARNLSPDQRVERGTEMYRIVDLSKVLIFARVLPGEMSVLRPGTKGRVVVHQTEAILEATVSPAVPLFDAERGFLQLKLEAQNPGLVLRPDMYVDIDFNIPTPSGISVPKEVIFDKGLQKIVYVEIADNMFESRVVELGATFGDRVLIQRGLSKDDRVVVSSNFLLDSESRVRGETLRAAVSGSR